MRAAAAVVGLGALLAACVPAGASTASGTRPVPLYVADAGAGTLVLVDGVSGRPLGRPRPAGPAPAPAVVAPTGAALVRSGSAAGSGGTALTYVPPGGGGAAARPVPLEPGARVLLLAGDGGDYAAAVYTCL